MSTNQPKCANQPSTKSALLGVPRWRPPHRLDHGVAWAAPPWLGRGNSPLRFLSPNRFGNSPWPSLKLHRLRGFRFQCFISRGHLWVRSFGRGLISRPFFPGNQKFFILAFPLLSLQLASYSRNPGPFPSSWQSKVQAQSFLELSRPEGAKWAGDVSPSLARNQAAGSHSSEEKEPRPWLRAGDD